MKYLHNLEISDDNQEKDRNFKIEEVHKAFQEVAYSYYMRGKNIQYNSFKADYFSPEEASSQNIKYVVCSAFAYNVYLELFNITIPKYGKNLLDHAKNNIGQPEVVGQADNQKISNISLYNESTNRFDYLYNPKISQIIPYLKPGDIFTDSGHVVLIYKVEKDDAIIIESDYGRLRTYVNSKIAREGKRPNGLSFGGINHYLYYSDFNNNGIIEGSIGFRKLSDEIFKNGKLIPSRYSVLRFIQKDKDGNAFFRYKVNENFTYNEPIIFDYFHKFNKEGNYTIRYSFKNLLAKTNFLFGECGLLSNINLSNFNTQNVNNMSCMFGKCTSLNNINFDNINTQNVINMSGMFFECKSLENIDLSKFNTQKVKNMQMMFKKCESLKNINLSSFNTQNVTTMSGMFEGCKSLENINLSNFNTLNVTDMSGMFDSCKALTSIELTNLNTQKVTNMSCMFCECRSLKNVILTNFKTDNVTNMYCMFFNCKSLTNLDLSNFNTKNVTDMGSIFYGCESLTNMDLSKFNTKNVIDMSEMFYNCKQLTKLDLSNFDTKNVKNIKNSFNGCINLNKEDVKVKDNKIIQEI